MATTIKIYYELTYVKCELADERVESNPVLRVYYDTHFIRTEAGGGINTIHLDEHDSSKVYKNVLVATTDVLMANKIPATACIGMAQYAQRRNEYDMACYTNAGTTHVSFGAIYKAMVTEKRSSYMVEKPLLLETTRLMGEPVEKGVVRIKVTKVELGKRVKLLRTELCPLGAPISQIDNMVETFIQRRVKYEGSMADTWPGIKNVRAPMDISSAGIELLGKCFVPIEGFAIEEPFESNVGYFENAYRQIMIRRNLDPDHDWNALDRVHRAEVMAAVCTYAPQSFDYISDTVDMSNRLKEIYDLAKRLGFEDFNCMGTTLSGDCEDGAKLTQLIFFALCHLDMSNAGPILQEIQQIAKMYVYFLTLATVHGAKAEDQTEHIGAHMYGMLIPKHQVLQALRSNEMGNQLLSKLPVDDYMKSAGMPTLFCEGTGNIRSLGPGPVMTVNGCVRSAAYTGDLSKDHPMSHDPLIVERRLIGLLMKTKGGLKIEIPHDYGAPSNFYLGNLLLVTDEWLRLGYNVGAFICGNIDKQKKCITRGAKFIDIINQTDSFSMIPCEPIPQPIMDITREAVALRAPSRPFTFDKNKPVDGSVKNKELERLKTSINNLRRKGESPYGSVDVFMRDHQFNAPSISRMIKDLKQIGPLYKVDYQMQPITNSVHTYRVMLYLDKKGAEQALKKLQTK